MKRAAVHPFRVSDTFGESESVGCWTEAAARALCARLNAAERSVTGAGPRWEVVPIGPVISE